MLGVNAGSPKQFPYSFCVDRMPYVLAGRDLTRQLPRYRTDLTLELSHSTLASVVRHHRHDRIAGEGDFLVAQPRFFQLPRQQVLLRDLGLFLLRVTGELDNLHPIEQGAGNVLHEVPRRNE